MTIFGLKMDPLIINGRHIKSINEFYKGKIKSKQQLMEKQIKKAKANHKPKKHRKFIKFLFTPNSTYKNK